MSRLIPCVFFFLVSTNLYASAQEIAIEEEIEATLTQLAEKGWKPMQADEDYLTWGVDGYDDASNKKVVLKQQFATLNITNLWELIEKIQARTGRKLHVLDVFGSGFEFAKPAYENSVESSTGIRLSPYSNQLSFKKFDLAKEPTEILGDALDPTTWTQLDAHMHLSRIDKMDFILMTPIAAWYEIGGYEKNQNRHYDALKVLLLQSALRLHDHGYFLFALENHWWDAGAGIAEFVADMKEQTGRQVELVVTNPWTTVSYFYGILYPKASQ